MYARRNHLVLRRASLCLLVAFALTLSPFPAGEVLAADVSVIFPANPTIAGTSVTIPLLITPLTSFSTGTITLVFRKNGSIVGTGTPEVSPWVYADFLALTAVAYGPVPAGFGTSGQLSSSSLATVSGTTVGLVIYIDEVTPSGEGTGGTGTGGTGTGGTTGTDTGWQSYNATTDTSTVYVDPGKTEKLYTAPAGTGVVIVEAPRVAPGGTTPKNVTASVPLDVVNQGGAATAPSILNMGSIEMALKPEIMRSLGESLRREAGIISSLKVVVKTSTQQGTDETLGSLPAGTLTDLTPVSQVITVSFVAVDALGRESALSVDRSSVSVSFDPDVVNDPSKVNLYMIGSLIYMGGKVDVAASKVIADLTKLSGGKLVALEYDKSFSDIWNHWAKRDIELMASKYIVKGMTDTEFWPDSAVTRAQFVTLLVRSLGLTEEKPATPTFKDVALSAWYYGYVEAAYKAGLASGDAGSGGLFRPTANVSREEMAALLVRAMSKAGTPARAVSAVEVRTLLGRFTDSSSLGEWAKTEVSQAVNEGLIRGRVGGQFDPEGNGTRAEAATMMNRFAKQVGKL